MLHTGKCMTSLAFCCKRHFFSWNCNLDFITCVCLKDMLKSPQILFWKELQMHNDHLTYFFHWGNSQINDRYLRRSPFRLVSFWLLILVLTTQRGFVIKTFNAPVKYVYSLQVDPISNYLQCWLSTCTTWK